MGYPLFLFIARLLACRTTPVNLTKLYGGIDKMMSTLYICHAAKAAETAAKWVLSQKQR